MGARLGDGFAALAADGVIDHVRGDGAVWATGLRPDQDSSPCIAVFLPLASAVRPCSLDMLLETMPERALAVVLCGISNHDNLGSIFRNAAAFEEIAS